MSYYTDLKQYDDILFMYHRTQSISRNKGEEVNNTPSMSATTTTTMKTAHERASDDGFWRLFVRFRFRFRRERERERKREREREKGEAFPIPNGGGDDVEPIIIIIQHEHRIIIVRTFGAASTRDHNAAGTTDSSSVAPLMVFF